MLTSLRQRYPWLDWTLTVNERVGAIGGGPLAASIAMAAFLSLFPMILVGIAVLGYFSADDTDFAQKVVDEIGLEGEAADTVLDSISAAERNRQATTAVGVAGLAWSGLAVVGAIEASLNAAWQVKGRGMRGKPRAVLLMGLVGVLLMASTAGAHFLEQLPGPLAYLSLTATLFLDTALLLAMFKLLTNVPVGWRAHLPGAVIGGVGLFVLKVVSGTYLPRLIESSDVYGSIGIVFALLAWFMLFARLLVYSSVINVVSYEYDRGTVTAEIQLPRIAGQVPLAATRGGAVADAAPAD